MTTWIWTHLRPGPSESGQTRFNATPQDYHLVAAAIARDVAETDEDWPVLVRLRPENGRDEIWRVERQERYAYRAFEVARSEAPL